MNGTLAAACVLSRGENLQWGGEVQKGRLCFSPKETQSISMARFPDAANFMLQRIENENPAVGTKSVCDD